MSVVALSYTHPHTHTNEWFVKEVSRKDWRRERGRDKVGEACNWEIQDAKNLTKISRKNRLHLALGRIIFGQND